MVAKTFILRNYYDVSVSTQMKVKTITIQAEQNCVYMHIYILEKDRKKYIKLYSK